MKHLLFILLFVPVSVNAQIITTIAGGGTGGDGVPATAASIYDPNGLAFDAYGNLYFADNLGSLVRKIDTSGIITTIAGTGTTGFSGDGGPSTAAQIDQPPGITVDAIGNLYIADAQNNRIRKVTVATGVISTVVGNGTAGFSGDGGLATAAALNRPSDVCFDNLGNLYIADNVNSRVRKVNTLGVITTFAGNGLLGSTGDGGPATAAECTPYSICIDHSGNLLIAEEGVGLGTIRKVDTSGIITTIAGSTSGYTYNGDGIPATSATLDPSYIAFNKIGELLISDTYNNRIRKIDSAGIIHTVAGNGTNGYTGDAGMATSAEISEPSGIAFDVCGNLYVGQVTTPRIRKVTYPPILTTPTISISGPTFAFPGSPVTVNATVANAGSSYIIHWLNDGIEFTTTTVPSVTFTKSTLTDTITARVVSTATYGCYDSTTSGNVIVYTGEGINTLSPGESLNIYPNPANDALHIDGVTTKTRYRLLSMVGAVLQTGSLKAGRNRISLAALPGGIYMLEVTDGTRKLIRKIVKE